MTTSVTESLIIRQEYPRNFSPHKVKKKQGSVSQCYNQWEANLKRQQFHTDTVLLNCGQQLRNQEEVFIGCLCQSSLSLHQLLLLSPSLCFMLFASHMTRTHVKSQPLLLEVLVLSHCDIIAIAIYCPAPVSAHIFSVFSSSSIGTMSPFTSSCFLTFFFILFIPSARFTVLFSHGNAVDLGQMSSFYIGLGTRINCNIFSYDYSGYGVSTGKPSEKNLYADIDAAWHALRSR